MPCSIEPPDAARGGTGDTRCCPQRSARGTTSVPGDASGCPGSASHRSTSATKQSTSSPARPDGRSATTNYSFIVSKRRGSLT